MQWFQIYAPLQGFQWLGDEFEIAPGILLKRYNQNPDLQDLYSTISKDELEQISNASHWLTFPWIDGNDLFCSEIIHLVILALWVVKPTKTHVAYQFKVGQGRGRVRMHDRFHWIQGMTEDNFEDSDLQKVSLFFKGARSICCARGRLNNALFLTLAGCSSAKWSVALICHAAASEAMLTYDTGPGITRRLARSYACMVEEKSFQRDVEFDKFQSLYSKRSDIVHGRTHQISESEHLKILGDFESVNRKLWQVILSKPNLVANLEGSDEERRKYFLQIQNGYYPKSAPNV